VGDIVSWGTAELGTEVALVRTSQWRPDVVYVHGLTSPVLEARLVSAWPGVLFAHGYYGTCETGTKRHASPQFVLCTRRFGPACLLLHYPRRCGGLNPVTMVEMYRVQAARNALLANYRAICVASAHMRAEYCRHGVAEDRLHLVPLPPSGIQRDAAPPEARRATGHVVMIGRLTGLKGGNILLDGLAIAGRELGGTLRLTVIGDGPERPRLEARALSLGINARFLGWAGSAERNRTLRTADLLALPSLWPEPWGLVGLEAACAGVPTVAFAAGGIPEWLAAGESGELAPADPPTAAGLAAAIARALRDPEHFAQLCRGAWVRAGLYTMDRHADDLLAVLAGAAR
jgi:glycosyltransferase involved in cell wall biosynthesis